MPADQIGQLSVVYPAVTTKQIVQQRIILRGEIEKWIEDSGP